MQHSDDPDYIEVRIGDDAFVYGCSECPTHFRSFADKVAHENDHHQVNLIEDYLEVHGHPDYNLDIADFEGRRDDQ